MGSVQENRTGLDTCDGGDDGVDGEYDDYDDGGDEDDECLKREIFPENKDGFETVMAVFILII